MKKIFAAVFVFSATLFVAQNAAAQTAAELEELLNVKEITWAEAAYFTLASSAQALPANGLAAFQSAREQGRLPENAEAHGKARLDGLSLLLMRSFDVPGGLMYGLLHNPRYAYRELKALGFIRGRAYATDTVSGAEFLRILGNLLSYTGETEAPETATPVPEIPADDTPVIPPAQEERERIAEIIQTELAEKNITNTEVRAAAEGITISLNNIQFLPDSTELTEAEKQKLQNIAVILNEDPNRRILIAGHTAMAGSAEGRMRVSTDRAQAVADYLVALGCRRPDEFTVRGYGAERPLGDPSTPAGQALNRRVEITLLDEGKTGDE
jgi:outer membrane protein OmpA-like peptidoglycan-associated protein